MILWTYRYKEDSEQISLGITNHNNFQFGD